MNIFSYAPKTQAEKSEQPENARLETGCVHLLQVLPAQGQNAAEEAAQGAADETTVRGAGRDPTSAPSRTHPELHDPA